MSKWVIAALILNIVATGSNIFVHNYGIAAMCALGAIWMMTILQVIDY